MDIGAWGLVAVFAKALAYGASLMAAGSTLFLIALKPGTDIAWATRRIGVWVSLLGALATAFFLSVQAGYLLDDGLAGMVDLFMLGLVLDGPLGEAALARFVGLALIALALLIPALLVVGGGFGALLVAASFALAGHATAEPRLVLSVLIMIHVLGLGYWIGALWPLSQAVDHLHNREAADLAHRFGNQAMIVVPVLIVAGALFTFLRIDPLSALTTSTYGWALAGKLIVVSGLLALAVKNRRALVPAMQAGDQEAGAALKRSIRWEAVAFAVILLATAVLTTITPIPEPIHSLPTLP
jgi:putative copper resistance protein D